MDELITTSAQDSGDLSDITDWSDLPTSGDDDVAEVEAEETAEPTEADQPTDETQTDTADTETETETTEVTAETEKSTESHQFKLKYLGSEVAKSEDEVIALAQKGMDYDRVHGKYEALKTAQTELDTLKAEKAQNDEALSFLSDLAKGQGVSLDELVDRTRATIVAEREGVDLSVALAQVKLERKERDLKSREDKLAKTTMETDAETKAKAKQQADVKEFVEAYPTIDPKTIPKEVWEDVQLGKSLLTAYVKHENAQLKAKLEAEKLKAEAEKKNKENRSKSTGSKATAGNLKSGDPWLADLESRF